MKAIRRAGLVTLLVTAFAVAVVAPASAVAYMPAGIQCNYGQTGWTWLQSAGWHMHKQYNGTVVKTKSYYPYWSELDQVTSNWSYGYRGLTKTGADVNPNGFLWQPGEVSCK